MGRTKRILILLISVCLLIISGSIIGYSVTYSKYVLDKKSNNVSSVAMFGVSMTWSNNAFLNNYEKDNPSRVVVQSNSKALAPGISNELVLSLRGKCEINFNMKIKIIEEYSEHWKESEDVGAEDYHPIILTVRSTYLGKEIELIDNQISIDYNAAGSDLVEDIIIKWEWPGSLNDEADTYMSTLHDIATYSLSAETLATQFD